AGIREVDDPRLRRCELARTLCDAEHDRHRSQRLAQAACAGRLLPDATAGERHGLVRQPGLLPADADLDQDEVGPVERAVELVRHRQRSVVALLFQHPRREPADDLAALRIDVLEHELAYADPVAVARQPGDELRRVGRPAADHGDLHPFTPVRVTPSTNTFCARKKRTITGAITSRVAAIVRFHWTWCSDRNSERPIESTQWWGVSPTYSRGRKKSLNV